MNTDSGGCARKRAAMSVTLTAVKRVQSSPNLLASGQDSYSPDSAKGFRSVRPNLQERKSPTQGPPPPPRKGRYQRSSTNYQEGEIGGHTVGPLSTQPNKDSILYSAMSSSSMRQTTTNPQVSFSNVNSEHVNSKVVERKQDSKERRVSTLKLILKEYSSGNSPYNTLPRKAHSSAQLDYSPNLLAHNSAPERHTASLSVAIASKQGTRGEENPGYHGPPAAIGLDTFKAPASISGQKTAAERQVVY